MFCVTSTQRQAQMYFLVNASPLKPLAVLQNMQLHKSRDVVDFVRH